MEVSSFPFLNQDDCTNIFGFLRDLDSPNQPPVRDNDNTTNDDLEAINKMSISEILGTLLLLDEEDRKGQECWSEEFQLQKSLLDSIHKRKLSAIDDFYKHFQDQSTDINGIELTRSKRSRLEAAGTLLTFVSHTVLADEESNQSSPVGSGGRRLWVKHRSNAWWGQCNSPDFPEEEFKKAFRMSKATFDMICEELESVVIKKDTMLRLAIPVRQRVAVCIWRLATGEPLRVVSKRFGLGISTCHKLILEVCYAIRDLLLPKFVGWPDENKLKMIKEEFKLISDIPDVGGSMYTTHVPIIAPKSRVAAYFNKNHTERNQRTSYSVTVQGVVDPNGVFNDICIGFPGTMSDEKVLEKSTIYQKANEGRLRDVWVVGNYGHPLMDWILVPYSQEKITWSQHAFNDKIWEVQRVAREAFMRLKGRWACLQKRTEVKLQDLPLVLGACCVLHNICEIRNEVIDPELSFELFDDVTAPEKPVRSVGSLQARDRIAHNLLHHNLAGTSFM